MKLKTLSVAHCLAISAAGLLSACGSESGSTGPAQGMRACAVYTQQAASEMGSPSTGDVSEFVGHGEYRCSRRSVDDSVTTAFLDVMPDTTFLRAFCTDPGDDGFSSVERVPELGEKACASRLAGSEAVALAVYHKGYAVRVGRAPLANCIRAMRIMLSHIP